MEEYYNFIIGIPSSILPQLANVLKAFLQLGELLGARAFGNPSFRRFGSEDAGGVAGNRPRAN